MKIQLAKPRAAHVASCCPRQRDRPDARAFLRVPSHREKTRAHDGRPNCCNPNTCHGCNKLLLADLAELVDRFLRVLEALPLLFPACPVGEVALQVADLVLELLLRDLHPVVHEALSSACIIVPGRKEARVLSEQIDFHENPPAAQVDFHENP